MLVADLYKTLRETKFNDLNDYLKRVYKHPLLKYYDKVGEGRAKSCLYIPYWNKRGLAKFPSSKVFMQGAGSCVSLNANEEYWSKSSSKDGMLWTEGVCKLRFNSEEFLGVDLFTNESPGQDVASPQALARKHTTHSSMEKANPCLVVVSGNNVCINNANTTDEEWADRFTQIYNSKWFRSQDKDPETWTETRPRTSQQQPWPPGVIPETLAEDTTMNPLVHGIGNLNINQSHGELALGNN